MNDKKSLMVAIVLAALAIGAGGYYFFGRGDNSSSATSVVQGPRKPPPMHVVNDPEPKPTVCPPEKLTTPDVRKPPHAVQPRPTHGRRPPRRDRHPHVKKDTLPPAA